MVDYRSDQAATYVEYSTNKLALIDRLDTGWGESNKIEVVISGTTDSQVRVELPKNTPTDFASLDRHLSTYPKLKSLKRFIDKRHSEPIISKRFKTSESSEERRCYHCNKVGHVHRNCLLLKNKNRSESSGTSIDRTKEIPKAL